MAKVKAPLFGLGASGALGKSLVYFPWKGLNCCREFVVPTNPRSAPQLTQRGYVSDAVEDIHAAMGHPTLPLNETDKTAYAAWASVIKASMTWFNMAVKNWVDVTIAGDTPAVYRDGTITPGANQIAIALRSDEFDGATITAGKFYYGTSKTSLVNTEVAVIVPGVFQASATIAGLTTGQKYYIQFRPDAGEDAEGAYSGIYHGTPT